MSTATLFHALGDPVRLELVERLAARQPCRITALAQGLTISRQGARKHLQVLVDAGLVVLEAKGRESHARLRNEALDPARAFLVKLERQWDRRLQALKRSVEGDEHG